MHQIYFDIKFDDNDPKKYQKLKCIITNLNNRSDSVIYFGNGNITIDMIDMCKHYFNINNVVRILYSDKFEKFIEYNDNQYKWFNFGLDILIPKIIDNKDDLKFFYRGYKY